MTLVNLSGGVDSTFVLWRHLEAGDDVLVHHCSMENTEHRATAEDHATAAVLGWFADRGHHPPVVHTSMDVSAIRRLTDPQVLGFLTGLICREHRTLAVDLCFSASDRPATRPSLEWFARGQRIAEQVAGRSIEWRWPIRELTKPEIIAALPPDLLALCWSCRRPRAGRACGRCATCRRLSRERRTARSTR